MLFYLEGNSVREAAGLLGISEGAFKVRLHRARGKLREAMEERLERSLQDIVPRAGLRKRILAVVPAFPLGWGAGAVGIGYLLTAAGWAFLTAPALAYAWYGCDRMAKNYRQQGGFRQALLRRRLVSGSVVMVVIMVAAGIVMNGWGWQGIRACIASWGCGSCLVSCAQHGSAA